MIQVEIEINHRKPQKLNAYKNEIYEFKEKLTEKYPGWEEFIVSSPNQKLKHHFIKVGNKLVSFKKNLDLMRLTVFLDKNHPKWTRFAISSKKYEEIKCGPDCKAGMLLRVSSSNALQYILVEDVKTNEKGVTEVLGNQEGKTVKFATNSRKKYKFSIIMQNIEEGDVSLLFAPPPSVS